MSTKSDLLTAKLNLKYIKESKTMNDHDLDKIAEKLAEKIKTAPPPHSNCPFNAETVASLKDLGYYFSTAQKAFKGFIVLCIVIGAITAFVIGVWYKISEFWKAIKQP